MSVPRFFRTRAPADRLGPSARISRGAANRRPARPSSGGELVVIRRSGDGSPTPDEVVEEEAC